MNPVKKVDGRAEKARLTRRKMLDAAGELFIERGYGATALQDVAERAGVAVQTIYFTFGNKRTLLKEVVDRTIAGDDEPIATLDRPWFRQALATATAEEHLRAHVNGTSAVLGRVAPIMKTLEAAAATDPGISALWPQGENPRLTIQSAAATSLMSKPGARNDVTVEHAADVMFGLLSPELYLLLVGERGWSPAQWEDWALETLRSQLCSV
ncbi:MAG TPA: helix-turn-helix domain-containing protein [Kribbella sp.]|nr:helix-turn-helix domain-containing protein [Kribbella sp.]